MNMLALNKTFASIAIGFILVTSTIGCKKETTYIYEGDDVLVTKDQSEKTVSKTMVEFISIAYADVFGLTISQNDLGQLSLLYLAFGDKVLIEDVLVKNMLNSPEANLPSDLEMRSNIEVYVKNAYLKLYNREPNELENFTLTKKISENPDMTSAMVYYAMMTSNEYRFY
jgi:hypothetical protein